MAAQRLNVLITRCWPTGHPGCHGDVGSAVGGRTASGPERAFESPSLACIMGVR